MAKPSYKLARKARAAEPKGDATMTIEGTDSTKGKVIDKTKPEPHTESLIPPAKPGAVVLPKIGPPDSPETLHATTGVARSGDYERPAFSGLSKT